MFAASNSDVAKQLSERSLKMIPGGSVERRENPDHLSVSHTLYGRRCTCHQPPE